MTDRFDRWLEASLQEQLRPAYGFPANPAQARYRRSLLTRGFRRGSSLAGKFAVAAGALIVLGTVGAEAAGYGPVHVGSSGVYVKLGVPATPNPPVTSPSDSAPPVTEPAATPAPTGEREDTSPGGAAQPQHSAAPSETPEREFNPSPSASPQHEGGTSVAPSGSPEIGDH